MHHLSNVWRRIRDSFRIASLGATLWERQRIFTELIIRSVGHRVPLMRRMMAGERVWKCTYNTTHFNLFLSGTHEEYMLIKEVFIDHMYPVDELHTPSVIVDCGANIGITAMYFHAMFPDARIIVVEPNPLAFNRLARMAAQTHMITPVHAAIGDRDGTTTFYVEKETLSSSLTKRSQGAQPTTVSVVTFESLLRDHGVDGVDLLKFDIEGAEEHLFASSSARAVIRAFIGEVHEDLMSMRLSTFCSILDTNFSYTLTPTRKRGRYIIRGHANPHTKL